MTGPLVHPQQVVLGIDLGTQGVRVLAVTPHGEVVASAHSTITGAVPGLPEGWFEQSPEVWWWAVRACTQNVIAQLPSGRFVAGVSVDSTSGTVLPVGAEGQPLYPAVMYNDRRSAAQAVEVSQAAAAHQESHGYVFGSSYALPKVLWFRQERPEVFEAASRFIHAADYIVGKLTGSFETSDTSNALKMGVDLHSFVWPDFISEKLAIPLDLLPQVVLPGTPVGEVCRAAAEETRLRRGVPVIAGATDGTAAQIASGASQPGDWNSTLGTTLVLKGISERLVTDPQGRFYSHRHPDGWWMPGGASNTGGEWIRHDHPEAKPWDLDEMAASFIPTGLVRYPLVGIGERFPFIHPAAVGFVLGQPGDEMECYAAGLEGAAYLERLAYDVVSEMGMEVGSKVYITGGGSRSGLWNRVRASVLGRQLARPAVTETAMGAAVLAAAGCWYDSLHTAVSHMVRMAETVDPDPTWMEVYQERCQAFRAELDRRGYLG